MKLRRSAFCCSAFLVLFSLGNGLEASPQATFYISPKGDDTNNGGTPDHAFVTLAKARDAVRQINSAMSGDIVVLIAKGDYAVTEPVSFTDQDSGTNDHRVIYQAADGVGSVRFIGGTKVSNWKPYKGNIYQADVGAGLAFTTLYENGILADLARWPKRTSPFATSRAGYMTFVDKQGENLVYQDNASNPLIEPFDPTGKDFSNAWVYAWNGGDGHRWSSVTSAVTATSAGTITIHSCGLGWPPDSFLVEGSLDLLSRPGEFFYDKSAGKLFYQSRFNGPVDQQEIIAPLVVRILDLAGSSPSSPVQNLVFSGLAFTDTDRLAQSGTDDWADAHQSSWDAAIHVKNAKAITFDKCKVADTGICGITFEDGTDSCAVSNCLIEHTGYHGISLINGTNHIVSDCLIRYAGELCGHGDGVSIMYDPKRAHGTGNDPTAMGADDKLSHLEIYYVPRAGVAVRGSNDVVEYVKVHDCVQDSGDQGAFYLVDPCNNASFNQCTSFHNYTDLSNMDRPPTAVYNDRDATNTNWSNIDAGDSQMFTFRHDPQKTGTLTFNNVSWDPKCNPRNNEVAGAVNPYFDKSKMEYDKIGLTADFPAEYNDTASKPTAPLNLWAESGNGEVRLHWTEADRAMSYVVKRSESIDGVYTKLAAVSVPPTGWDNGANYIDTSLTNGKTYFYTVASANAAGESELSLSLPATPNGAGSNKLTGTPIGIGGDLNKAFDGDAHSYYEDDSGWVGLDLGASFVITQIKYTLRSDNVDVTARMHDGEFQGSNDPDFSNPVTLYKILATKGGAGTPVSIPQTIYNNAGFRYVRFIGPKSYTAIAELEFYGHAEASH